MDRSVAAAAARQYRDRNPGRGARPRGGLHHHGERRREPAFERLRTRAADYDPAVRDRLIAGAMIPAPLVNNAQKFRRWYQGEVLKLFESVDAILAPATPCTRPAIGQQTFIIDGVELPVRPNIGIYTQPISFIRPSVVAVPVPLTPMPIGVAGDRCAVAGGRGAANRLCAGAGWRLRRAATHDVRSDMEIDLPEVVAEVRAAFDRYEKALTHERSRRPQHDLPRRAADDPLRHRREPLWP